MFCLFRNSKIAYPLNLWVLFISIAPVFYWLYFTLVEKDFLHNFVNGKTLFVDLLLGLPVVLIFAVVIYAMVFWVLKLIVILLWPSQIVPLKPLEPEDGELDPELGEDYWMKAPESSELLDEEQSQTASEQDKKKTQAQDTPKTHD
ncbi:hypothetical protein [Hydrogenovibrio kuenenii]|uniref:hypothetical protein n=1 Tax=Hydrogenovibrio kuenenii TaxID=63658 RepID=UPI0004667A56|nr:hypothetical protein [Hydrogenovibrio kuenenii]